MTRRGEKQPEIHRNCAVCKQPRGEIYYRAMLTKWSGEVEPPIRLIYPICVGCTSKLHRILGAFVFGEKIDISTVN